MPINRMWIALQRAILICLVRWIVAAVERCSLAAIERVVRTLVRMFASHISRRLKQRVPASLRGASCRLGQCGSGIVAAIRMQRRINSELYTENR